MRQIRRNVFETNSSSTHSISFSSRDEALEESVLKVANDGYIHIGFGEFGWEIETYSSQGSKLSYLLTMIACVNGLTPSWYEKDFGYLRTEITELDDFKTLNDEIIEYTRCEYGLYIDESYGYIDHQSFEDYRSLKDFLNDWGVKNCIEFIFGNVIVHTDNDNH